MDRTRAPIRDFECSLPMALLKAREAAMTRFRPMLRHHDLTEQQWRVIRVLAAYGQLDASALAQRSLLLAPSLTRILRWLEQGGLIQRLPDECDQRRSVFQLSSQGRKLYTTVGPHSEALYADIESQFGRDKLAQLYQLLSEFTQSLKPSGR